MKETYCNFAVTNGSLSSDSIISNGATTLEYSTISFEKYFPLLATVRKRKCFNVNKIIVKS